MVAIPSGHHGCSVAHNMWDTRSSATVLSHRIGVTQRDSGSGRLVPPTHLTVSNMGPEINIWGGALVLLTLSKRRKHLLMAPRVALFGKARARDRKSPRSILIPYPGGYVSQTAREQRRARPCPYHARNSRAIPHLEGPTPTGITIKKSAFPSTEDPPEVRVPPHTHSGLSRCRQKCRRGRGSCGAQGGIGRRARGGARGTLARDVRILVC